VTAAVLGPRTLDQLNGSLPALDITLNHQTSSRLDELFPGPGGEAPDAYTWSGRRPSRRARLLRWRPSEILFALYRQMGTQRAGPPTRRNLTECQRPTEAEVRGWPGHLFHPAT
jgi:hypothetical protein